MNPKLLINIFLSSLMSLYLVKKFLDLFKGKGCVLMFHRVINSKKELTNDRFLKLAISKSDFEKKIKFLTKNYKIISLDDFVSHLKSDSNDFCISLTFDDGYKDNLLNVVPIINKYKIPITIFVCTGFVNRTVNAWWYQINEILLKRNFIKYSFEGKTFNFNLSSEKKKIYFLNYVLKKYFDLPIKKKLKFLNVITSSIKIKNSKHFLNWKELKLLSKNPLVTIGAHTASHPCLASLNNKQLNSEILLSKNLLEKKIGKIVNYFSYPYGNKISASKREYNFVKESNFLAAFTTRRGIPTKEKLFCLPRENIGVNEKNFSLLETKLSGVRIFNYNNQFY